MLKNSLISRNSQTNQLFNFQHDFLPKLPVKFPNKNLRLQVKKISLFSAVQFEEKYFLKIVENSWKFREKFRKFYKNDSPKIPTDFPLAPNFRANNLRRIYPGKNRDLRGNLGIAQPPRNPANRRP
jgi:hypothetical protein